MCVFLCVCVCVGGGGYVFMNLFYKAVGKTRFEKDRSFSEQSVYDTVCRYTYSERCRRAAVGWHAAWT